MNHEPLIVIVTDNDTDGHIPFVTKHLKTKHIVVDPSAIIKSTELSFSVIRGKTRITYGSTSLDNVKSVWYRKPESYEVDKLPVDPSYVHYAHSALQAHWFMLRNLFPNAFWVSDYFQIRRAENKPRQLQTAKEIGFNVPDTLFTSSAKAAEQFVDKYGTVITKSLSYFPGISEDNGMLRAFFARKLTTIDKLKLTGLHLAPAVFQQLVDADVDIRVTVIGDKVFAATITGSAIDKAESPVRDWKVAHVEGDIRIKSYELPAEIAEMCVKHVQAFGLQFGAIDLIKDKKGVYWFIENNPNGQWAFVEELTHQPMGKALAELLDRGYA